MGYFISTKRFSSKATEGFKNIEEVKRMIAPYTQEPDSPFLNVYIDNLKPVSSSTFNESIISLLKLFNRPKTRRTSYSIRRSTEIY